MQILTLIAMKPQNTSSYPIRYIVIDIMQIIGKAKADTEDLPPKAKRQASLPSQTATAVGVHHEATNKLKPLNSAPHQTITDGSKPVVSTETDGDAGTNNDDSENTDTGTSEEQQARSFITVWSFVSSYMHALLNC